MHIHVVTYITLVF
jgi:hypothetical protein